MEIVLFSTNCPKCNVLSAKLNQKQLQFSTVTDEDEMIARGFMSAPMLEVDGEVMDFGEAIRWINGLGVSK